MFCLINNTFGILEVIFRLLKFALSLLLVSRQALCPLLLHPFHCLFGIFCAEDHAVNLFQVFFRCVVAAASKQFCLSKLSLGVCLFLLKRFDLSFGQARTPDLFDLA